MLTGCQPWLPPRRIHPHRPHGPGSRATVPTRAGPKAPTSCRRSSTSSSTCRRTTPTTRTSATFHKGDGYRLRAGVPTNSNVAPDGTVVPGLPRAGHLPDRQRRVAELGLHPHARSTAAAWTGSCSTATRTPCATGTAPTCRSTGRSPGPSRCATGGSPRRRRRPIRTACTSRPRRRQDLIATDIAKAFSMPLPAGGTIWDKLNAHGISWHDYAWDLPDIALFPKVWDANKDKVKTFQQFLTDCRSGALAVGVDRQPRRRRLHRGEPGRHPTRRGLQLVDHQRGHGTARRGRAPCCCSCTTSTAATTTTCHRRRPSRPTTSRRRSQPAPGAPAAWNQYGLRVPAFVISPFAKRALRLARDPRSHVGAPPHRDEVQPRRADPPRRQRIEPARLPGPAIATGLPRPPDAGRAGSARHRQPVRTRRPRRHPPARRTPRSEARSPASGTPPRRRRHWSVRRA